MALATGCQTTGMNAPGAIAPTAVAAPISEDEIAIAALFSKMETAWNSKDAVGYLALWVDGGELITGRGDIHIIRRNDSGTLSRMKSEGENQYRLKKAKIKEDGSALATVAFSCQQGNLTMVYDLVKPNGVWLIKRQTAH